MAEQLKAEHLEQSHSAVTDFIVNLVLNNLPAVLQTVLVDQTKLKKFRTSLVKARDVLNQALPPA
jgi:ATP/maltotriose-dependent transcriptional regulator MalT